MSFRIIVWENYSLLVMLNLLGVELYKWKVSVVSVMVIVLFLFVVCILLFLLFLVCLLYGYGEMIDDRKFEG